MKKIVTTALAGLIALSLCAAQEHKHGKDEVFKLGRQTIGGYTVSVNLIGSDLHASGEKAEFSIKLVDAKSFPKSLKVWAGSADAAGATKVEGKKDAKDIYRGEITAPSPYPKEAKLYVEIETDSGTQTGSYKLEVHDHKH